jgi:hypothetical protein
MTRAWPAWGFLCLLVAGCGADRSAGGGGFEGETVAIAGRVTHDGRDVAGAVVSYTPLCTCGVAQKTTTDGGGAFRLEVSEQESGFLEARSGDTVLGLWQAKGGDTALQLEAPRPVLWAAQLRMGDAAIAGATLHIVGSTQSARSDAQGRFTLARTGNGQEWATVELPDGSVRDVRLPATSGALLVLPDHPSVLLDDFEGADTRSVLGNAIGSGWWFAVTDSQSSILPVGTAISARNAYTTKDAYSGTSLSVQFRVNPSGITPYGILGVTLSDTGYWTDLSTLDSVTFLAKGTGNARIVFVTRCSLEPTIDQVGWFGAARTLPSAWTRVVLRKDEISAPAGSRSAQQGISWATASKQVRSFGFIVSDTVSLQLDSIVFHGPHLSDLAPRR